mmetsp:Transcript_12659/g.23095  ORF Transcript_12659/g.23095 Transcript_12659/m.23095 type:complete len:218 (-) Transcript_12659:801-1454(-)
MNSSVYCCIIGHLLVFTRINDGTYCSFVGSLPVGRVNGIIYCSFIDNLLVGSFDDSITCYPCFIGFLLVGRVNDSICCSFFGSLAVVGRFYDTLSGNLLVFLMLARLNDIISCYGSFLRFLLPRRFNDTTSGSFLDRLVFGGVLGHFLVKRLNIIACVRFLWCLLFLVQILDCHTINVRIPFNLIPQLHIRSNNSLLQITNLRQMLILRNTLPPPPA